jgi:hypothetical protein
VPLGQGMVDAMRTKSRHVFVALKIQGYLRDVLNRHRCVQIHALSFRLRIQSALTRRIPFCILK